MDSVMGRVGLFAVGGVLLAGCKVGPDYKAPEVAVPANWNAETPVVPTTQPPTAVTQWWTTFNDPVLDDLIENAVRANLDLRIAAARVREARALRRVAGSGLFPMIDATGSYQRSRQSENVEGFDLSAGGTGGGHGGVGGLPEFNPGDEMDLYQAGFDASWELDVFGGVRRSIEAARADVDAAIEDARDVYVTLLAELARNYVDLRGLQRQLAIARANLKSQEETLNLTKARFDAGLVGELDVSRARTQVKTTESAIPTLETQVRAAAHRIEVLSGTHPGSMSAKLTGVDAPLPAVPPAVPVGLPSDLLRRRPDIRRAERQLAATTARIGVATAELFPRFSLTGSFGFESSEASDLGDWDSRFFSIGPAVRFPLFDRGRIRANIAAENAREQAALATYERAVLVALEDVENSLVAYAKEQQRRQSLAEAVSAARRSVELATELYSRGLTDFLSVLEAQRSQFEVEDQLAESDRLVASNVVGLYKALGGGWEETTLVNGNATDARKD